MFDFLSKKFSGILSWVKGKGRLTEENIAQAMDQVREALLEADVPFDVTQDFLEQVKNEIVGQKVQASMNPGEHLIKVVYDKLLDFLGGKLVVYLKDDHAEAVFVGGQCAAGQDYYPLFCQPPQIIEMLAQNGVFSRRRLVG